MHHALCHSRCLHLHVRGTFAVRQVEAAVARKAQKEMGEVTSDHTFKPKLRRAQQQSARRDRNQMFNHMFG